MQSTEDVEWQRWVSLAEEKQRSLTKPVGSLGDLETIANHLCAMQRTLTPSVATAQIYIFAGDHGVYNEGVSAFPQVVSRHMVANFRSGGAAINALAANARAGLEVIEVGVIGGDGPYHVRDGSANFCQEPAMTTADLDRCLRVGRQVAAEAIAKGAKLLAVGEMGIANTTAASAIAAAMTNREANDVCGTGTGLDAAGLERKRIAVRRALDLHRLYIQDPQGLLQRLGGLELAAICGFCLQAAEQRTAVILDGFITTAAAAVSVALNPAVRRFLIAGHLSTEPGHEVLLQHLKLKPLLRLHLRLGEGTGAALAIPIVQGAVAAFNEMATFESAQVANREGSNG